MKNTIEKVIVSFVKLGIDYYRQFGTSLQIEEKEVIPFEILKMASFICVPDEEFETPRNALEEIEKTLQYHFVDDGENKFEFVKVVGYEMNNSEDSSGYEWFKAWCLFQYTFLIPEDHWQERNEFLWVSILFPYVYKFNKFFADKGKNAKQKMLKELLDKYPLPQTGKKTADVFKKFKLKAMDDAYLKEVLNREENLGFVIKEAYLNATIEECRCGIAVAMKWFDKSRRKHGTKN